MEHEKRLRQGKSYDEFETEWLKKKPPEDQLVYYGSWPDAKSGEPDHQNLVSHASVTWS